MRREGRRQGILEQVGFRGVHCPVAYLEALPPVKQFRLLHPVGTVGREQIRRSSCTTCHPCFQKPSFPLPLYAISAVGVLFPCVPYQSLVCYSPVCPTSGRCVTSLTLDVRAIPRQAQKPRVTSRAILSLPLCTGIASVCHHIWLFTS